MVWEPTEKFGISVKKGLRLPPSYPDDARKQYFYLCFIDDREDGVRYLKCGTTCRPLKRMEEHLRDKGAVSVLWFSPVYGKYTALKVEDTFKDYCKNHLGWFWKRNDRFVMPEGVEVIEVQVKKTYYIPIT